MTVAIRSLANIAYLTSAALVIGILMLNTGAVSAFVKQQSIELEANRVQNGVKAMGSMPEGYVEIGLEGYRFDYSNKEFSIAFKDKMITRDLSEGYLGDYNYEWGHDEKKVKTLCIRKSTENGQETIIFEKEGC